jgi:hypothetical protein
MRAIATMPRRTFVWKFRWRKIPPVCRAVSAAPRAFFDPRLKAQKNIFSTAKPVGSAGFVLRCAKS